MISDTFTDIASSPLTLTTTPTFDFANLGSSEGTIKPLETAHYNATYLINQAVIDAGGVINSVTVTASSTGGLVSDTSDDGIDTDGNTADDVTVLVIDPNPIIEATKTVSITDNNGNGLTDLGDLLTYTILLENKGNVTLSGLTISDTLTDGNSQLLTLTTTPTFVSATINSTSTTLQVSGLVSYTASFIIDQQAVDSGQVNNTVLATASSPGQANDVTDRSDDGDDSDGNTTNDPTVVSLTTTPSLEVVKSAVVSDVNGNSITDKDDIITCLLYTSPSPRDRG